MTRSSNFERSKEWEVRTIKSTSNYLLNSSQTSDEHVTYLLRSINETDSRCAGLIVSPLENAESTRHARDKEQNLVEKCCRVRNYR